MTIKTDTLRQAAANNPQEALSAILERFAELTDELGWDGASEPDITTVATAVGTLKRAIYDVGRAERVLMT